MLSHANLYYITTVCGRWQCLIYLFLIGFKVVQKPSRCRPQLLYTRAHCELPSLSYPIYFLVMYRHSAYTAGIDLPKSIGCSSCEPGPKSIMKNEHVLLHSVCHGALHMACHLPLPPSRPPRGPPPPLLRALHTLTLNQAKRIILCIRFNTF